MPAVFDAGPRLLPSFALSLVVHALVLGVLTLMEGGARPASPSAVLSVAGLVMGSAPRRDESERVPVLEARPAAHAERGAASSRSTVSKSAAPSMATAAPASEGTPMPADDIGTVDRYRMAFAFALRRVVPGTFGSNEAGPRVRVMVRVAIDASGVLEAVTVVRSSGHASVDARASDLVRRAYEAFPLPATLRGRSVAFDVVLDAEALGENATT